MNETAELEREAEAARQRMADTADTIRKKLTAGQLFDEFAEMFTGGDLSRAVDNLKVQVRDNPMPVVLVGASLAWLAFGKGSGGHAEHASHENASARPPQGGMSQRGHSMLHGASDIAGSVADGAKAAATSVSATVGKAADALSETGDRLRHSMLTGSSHDTHMPKSIAKLTSQEPLLIAAAGLTIGAIIGASLPSTELEKEQLGPQARRLREKAGHMVEKGRESASRVAAKAYDAAKEEANRQGLAPGDGKSLGERAGEVVRSAAHAVEDTARQEIGVDDEGSARRS